MPKKILRNMIGYGAKGKSISWPNNARLALQIVLNYEEGGENCVFKWRQILRNIFI
jgi:allantoinase